MPRKDTNKSTKILWIGCICTIAIAGAVALMIRMKTGPEPPGRPGGDPTRPETALAPSGGAEPGAVSAPIKMPVQPGPDSGAGSEQSPPVVDYGKLKGDETLQALMEKRKEKYGFEKGVDLIIKPEESIKVGDQLVPMKEIIDKIQIQSGEVVEKDLAPLQPPPLEESIGAVERRYRELNEKLETEGKLLDAKTRDSYEAERAELGKILSVYESYRQTEKRIEAKKEQLAVLARPDSPPPAPLPEAETPPPPSVLLQKETDRSGRPSETTAPNPPGGAFANGPPAPRILPPAEASPPVKAPLKAPSNTTRSASGRPADEEALKKAIREEINTLLLQKGDLESEIKLLLWKDNKPEAYGIYIVQPSDNIWNVHFKFLKEYFAHRRIDLAPLSDEPDERGKSSGVGKILKFSEKMVFIYNLKDRKLAADIHMIHPLSKIVVFNMSKVFDLLKNVDYEDIRHIRFDGENLWLPAES